MKSHVYNFHCIHFHFIALRPAAFPAPSKANDLAAWILVCFHRRAPDLSETSQSELDWGLEEVPVTKASTQKIFKVKKHQELNQLYI